MKLFSYCKNNHNFIAVKRLIGDWDFRTYLVVKDSNVFHDIVSQLKIQFNQDIRNYETWVIYYEHYFNSFPEVLLKSLVN